MLKKFGAAKAAVIVSGLGAILGIQQLTVQRNAADATEKVALDNLIFDLSFINLVADQADGRMARHSDISSSTIGDNEDGFTHLDMCSDTLDNTETTLLGAISGTLTNNNLKDQPACTASTGFAGSVYKAKVFPYKQAYIIYIADPTTERVERIRREIEKKVEKINLFTGDNIDEMEDLDGNELVLYLEDGAELGARWTGEATNLTNANVAVDNDADIKDLVIIIDPEFEEAS